jgi:hypothetical protein
VQAKREQTPHRRFGGDALGHTQQITALAYAQHVLMVEAEALSGEAQGTFTLKHGERGGTGTVPLDGVAFPQLQVSASPHD